MNRVLKLLHAAGTRALDALETRSVRNPPPTLPLVFIIGPPRSGSTLLYQAVVERFDVGYLSNLHARFYAAPSLIGRLPWMLRWRDAPASYESVHGRTEGWLSPSECGAFWYRFFRRRPQYVPVAEADEPSMRRMNAAVTRVVRSFRRPVVIKNMHCALRLQPIARWLPGAAFIVTHRDLLENARSLLAVRKRVFGNYDEWWSMEPPNLAELCRLEPQEQVVEQIRSIHALIENDSRVIGADRFFHVSYEEFCAEPRETLNEIQHWLSTLGVSVASRAEVPPRFDAPRTSKIDPDMDQRLVSYVEAAR